MVKNIWQLIKDTAVYGFSSAILLPLGLITLPVFTRVFVPADYGVIELVGTTASLMGLFAGLSMESAAQRSYFDSSNFEHRREVISTGLWFLIAWNLLVVGILLFFSGWISSLAFRTSQHADLLKIAFITVPFTLLVAYCQNTLRLHFSPWKFTIISLLSGLLTIGLSILFVLEFKMGLWGYFIGILAGTAVSLAPALYFIRVEIAFKFSSGKIKEMLLYGAPLVLASLAFYVLTMSNRFFLARFATVADVGLYGIAVKISSIMLFFNTAFAMAWPPLALKLYAESEQQLRQLISRVLKYILLLFFFLAVFLTTFAPELLYLFTTKEYFGAAVAIAPLCLSVVALATTQATCLGISLSRKTQYIALSAWIAAIANLGLNALLIPLWGILGASVATALSYIVLTLCYYLFAQRLYPISLDWRAILKICALGVIFVGIGVFLIFDNFFMGVLIKLGFVLLFIFVLLLFKVFDAKEVTYARQWLLSIKK